MVVERVNFIKRHVRPTQKNPQGGVIEREGGIHISNVQVVCPSCGSAHAGWACASRTTGRCAYCKKCNVQVDRS